MPKTWFSTPLSKNAKDTETRIRNIFEGQRRRPAVIVFALVAAVALLCGSVVAVRTIQNQTITERGGVSNSRPGPPGEWESLELLPEDYSLEQAKADGCVVLEDGQITSGKERFLRFVEKCAEMRNNSVRIAMHYTLGDPSRYDPDYYEEIKDTYPRLYIYDLTFTYNWGYFWNCCEDGELVGRKYSYLLRMEDPPDGPGATWDHAIRYVLVNDPNVTWGDIWHGMISSQSGAYIDHVVVYQEYVYADDAALEKTLATFRLTQEGSKAETPRESLLRALRGELAFPLDTSQTRSYSLDHEVTLSELTAEDGDTMAQAAYTFLDLDGDGTEEAVYQRSNYRGFYVLRWWEGKVFGYEFNYRGMMELKQDGTFGASGGAGDSGYCRLRFSDTELLIEPFMWRLENAVGEETCTIEGENISNKEYFRAMEEQNAKQDAEWTPVERDGSL